VNILKQLLSAETREQLKQHHVRMHSKDRFFFFGPSEEGQLERKETWIGKKTANRRVYEVKYQRKDPSKVAHHRHLSFDLAFSKLGDVWYAQIVPSWYYSYDGYRQSNWHDDLLSNQKRLEHNLTVRNMVRFVAYFLSGANKSEDGDHGLRFLSLVEFNVRETDEAERCGQFLSDCDKGLLPDYSFVEPNYNDHETDSGEEVASDQHPDHDVQAGERLIAEVYMRIKRNAQLWASTALLVVYDEHGGIYDHVVPPTCPPDKFTAAANSTGTGMEFKFDRLGVRVPAVLISPWIPKNTVVDRVFDHASIPATVTKFFLGDDAARSPRETNADVFVEPNVETVDPQRNLLSLNTLRTDCPEFGV